MRLHQTQWLSPQGLMLLAANDTALVGVWFHDQKYVPDWFQENDRERTSPQLSATVMWLEHYYGEQTAPNTKLPALEPVGTEFQTAVWQALLSIPHGSTQTYGQLAASLQKPRAVRAVAAAVGRNPISVLIPCHRVIGANGSLTGYAGGLQRKKALLDLESATLKRSEFA